MKRLLFFLTVATLVSCGRTFEQRTAKYAEVGSVNDNRAAVLDINEGVGRWGYVDGTGRLVIECRYADARSFDDGLAAVQEPEGLWGYIRYRRPGGRGSAIYGGRGVRRRHGLGAGRRALGPYRQNGENRHSLPLFRDRRTR